MKNTLILLFGLFAANRSTAQYTPTDQGSEIKFTINNFGFGVDGHFSGLQGTIDFDPQNPAGGKFDVSIDASTINTDNSLRDSHLRNESYFDVKNYPKIRLVSTRIASAGASGTCQFTGQLTIKKTTLPVSFPFTVSPVGGEATPAGAVATPAGGGFDFKGSFTIKRKDFDVGGTSTISNELTVSLNVMATK
jgi:polyisoprenoid-binding protein YceI